jgi:excisionase family DNA binding protein
MEETLLDSRQVAARLNISRSYVYFLMRVGDLPCIRIGNAIRVRPRDLERYLQQRIPSELAEILACASGDRSHEAGSSRHRAS